MKKSQLRQYIRDEIGQTLDGLTTKAHRGKQDEVSPPGWSGTTKAMKKHKKIDNPFALAWWKKKHGAKPHYKPESAGPNIGMIKVPQKKKKDEVSTSAAAGPFMTPKAFTAPTKRANDYRRKKGEVAGYKIVPGVREGKEYAGRIVPLKSIVEDVTGNAGEEAKRLGLKHLGWGRYADPHTGTVTHVSNNGKLVPIERADAPSVEKDVMPNSGNEQDNKEIFPGVAPQERWWESDPHKLMGYLYWLKGQMPPADSERRKAAYRNIVSQLHKKYPAPTEHLQRHLGA